MRLGVQKYVLGDEVVAGDVEVTDGTISRVGVHPAGPRGMAVPGLIDLQVNGFAGVDFSLADVAAYGIAAEAMAATGVTAYQPTLICMPFGDYPAALAVAAEAQQAAIGSRLVGVHLEGPFLSPQRAGAHDPADMLTPDRGAMTSLLDGGPVGFVTIAPEVPGAIGLIELCRERGITVAIGHSDADAAVAHSAIDAGAQVVTHLFSAQRPWRHRDPGIAGVALVRDDVVVTLILDGHHLARETVEIVRRCARGRIVLITDAISAAGRPDGTYPLGPRTVHVAAGRAQLDDGTLAGSVLTMDQAIRNFVSLGASLPEAIGAATLVPARVLDRGDMGCLDPGSVADITVLDDRLEVVRTVVGGAEVYAA
jgi:N-acetylglucosamine-6-phosphate deacetylase